MGRIVAVLKQGLVCTNSYKNHCFFFFPNEDSTHERAGSNLRYFEKLLEKEREEKEKDKSVNKTVTTTEAVVQSGAYERPLDYLPERDIYEALCRGEGVKMVREKNFLTVLPFA